MTRDEWNAALIARHGADLHEKFSSATVAICGLGGLGSNIAVSLARAGVGKLILIDFDRVDISNLNRQQYKAAQIGMPKTEALRDNLFAIAPFLKADLHTVRMTEENAVRLVREADVVCEAFDDAQAKAMLVNCICETLPKTYLVAASGMAGLVAQLAVFGAGAGVPAVFLFVKNRDLVRQVRRCHTGTGTVRTP